MFAEVWAYRRSLARDENPTMMSDEVREISLQLWGSSNGDGNDYPYSYFMIPSSKARIQVRSRKCRNRVINTILNIMDRQLIGKVD
jgi:hypothetical protein